MATEYYFHTTVAHLKRRNLSIGSDRRIETLCGKRGEFYKRKAIPKHGRVCERCEALTNDGNL